MPNKNLTDAEIIKALEHIEAFTCCEDCAFYKKCKGKCVITTTLDLINRLKAENSNLTSDLTSLQNDLTSAKAEIERLNKEVDLFADIGKMYSEIKAEAYKECIDMVKKKGVKVGVDEICIFEGTLDNLLKEMVGDNDGDL